MHKLIAVLAGLATAPILGVALLQATAPAFADVTVGSANACVQQSANPHPTDPAGSTTNTLFCASPSPTTNGSGTGTGSTGSGGTGSGTSGAGGSHGSGTTTAGMTAGGSQGTLAGSGSGTPTGSHGSGVSKSSGKSGQASDGGFFGGLVGFFSATGGLVFLFALLVLMALVLLAVAVIAWLRAGQEGSWASRASRLTFRPKN